MLLKPFPELDSIDLTLEGGDLEAALKQLFDSLRSHEAMRDPVRAWADLLTRQAAGSVALDGEVALPHARTSGVDRILVAAGRHPTGVSFDQKNLQVRLIFLVLTPKERPAEYLQVLASLASRLRLPDVRRLLLATTSPVEFAALLKL